MWRICAVSSIHGFTEPLTMFDSTPFREGQAGRERKTKRKRKRGGGKEHARGHCFPRKRPLRTHVQSSCARQHTHRRRRRQSASPKTPGILSYLCMNTSIHFANQQTGRRSAWKPLRFLPAPGRWAQCTILVYWCILNRSGHETDNCYTLRGLLDSQILACSQSLLSAPGRMYVDALSYLLVLVVVGRFHPQASRKREIHVHA